MPCLINQFLPEYDLHSSMGWSHTGAVVPYSQADFLNRVGHVVRDSQAVPQQSWLCGPWLPGWSVAELAVWSLTPSLVLSRAGCVVPDSRLVISRVGCVVPDSRAGPQQSWLCGPWLQAGHQQSWLCGPWLLGWSSAELAVWSLSNGLVISRVDCVVLDSWAGHQQSWLCDP